MLGPDAGERHAFVTEPAQEQRARRIEAAEVGEIERALLALFQRLPERPLGFRQRVDVEHAFERQAVAFTADGKRRRDLSSRRRRSSHAHRQGKGCATYEKRAKSARLRSEARMRTLEPREKNSR